MGQTLSEPGGSWKNSTDSYTFDKTTGLLTANLKARDGSILQSSVIVTHGMALENDDGKFIITTKGHYSVTGAYSNVLPAGNWMFTAKNISLENNILTAFLQKPDGTYSHSSIVVLEGYVVENDNGKFNIVKHSLQQEKLQYPLGSWINSAEDIELSVNNGKYMLKANLIANDGSKKYRTLTYSSKYDIFENENGNFKFVDNCRMRFKK